MRAAEDCLQRGVHVRIFHSKRKFSLHVVELTLDGEQRSGEDEEGRWARMCVDHTSSGAKGPKAVRKYMRSERRVEGPYVRGWRAAAVQRDLKHITMLSSLKASFVWSSSRASKSTKTGGRHGADNTRLRPRRRKHPLNCVSSD